MIRIIKADEKYIEELVKLRMDVIREVNGLREDYNFTESFVNDTDAFFRSGRHITYLAIEDGIIGCATMCLIDVLPTFDHPSGKRAHIMNVYTKSEHRKQGVASTLLYMLIDYAKENGITEITLDAAKGAEKIYYQSGFEKSEERMVMDINKMLKRNIEAAEKNGCKPKKCCC